VVGIHLVDEAELHLIADPEGPVNLCVLGPGVAIDQLPAHVGWRRHPVDLDHVVFPLDSLRGIVRMASAVVLVVLVVLGVMVMIMAVMLSVGALGGSSGLVKRRGLTASGRPQGHAALRARRR